MKTIQKVSVPIVHRGTMATEIVVAAVLLMAGITFLSSLMHRIHCVMQTSRQYQLGTQVLANQVEWITSTCDAESFEGPQPLPSFVVDRLPQANLKHKLLQDGDGNRVVLQLEWHNPALHRIEMVGWFDNRSGLSQSTTKQIKNFPDANKQTEKSDQ